MTLSLVKCLETDNKVGFITAISTLNLPTAFESGTGVRKLYLANSKRAYGAIINLIKDTVLYFNIGKGIKPDTNGGYAQMLEIALLIIEEFPGLRFEEIALVFKNAKKGVYGKLYDSMDGLTIIGWIREYENTEREAYLVKRNTKYKAPSRDIEIVDVRNMSEEEAKEARDNMAKLNEQMYSSYKKVQSEKPDKRKGMSEEEFKFYSDYWSSKDSKNT
jgi:hypothetical protein